MSRNFSFAPGEFYHIYQRGVDKRTIFKDGRDYQRFLALLYLCNSNIPIEMYRISKKNVFLFERGDTIVNIGAYCLMRNHFHVLVHEKQEGGISKFMQKLSTGFTMYFNKRSDRTGALFEGRFRAKHLNTDNYLKYIFSYIHLNPTGHVEHGWKENGIKNKKSVKRYLEQYHYSTFFEYTGTTRPESSILNQKAFPIYFKNKRDFLDEIEKWLNRGAENVGG